MLENLVWCAVQEWNCFPLNVKLSSILFLFLFPIKHPVPNTTVTLKHHFCLCPTCRVRHPHHLRKQAFLSCWGAPNALRGVWGLKAQRICQENSGENHFQSVYNKKFHLSVVIELLRRPTGFHHVATRVLAWWVLRRSHLCKYFYNLEIFHYLGGYISLENFISMFLKIRRVW